MYLHHPKFYDYELLMNTSEHSVNSLTCTILVITLFLYSCFVLELFFVLYGQIIIFIANLETCSDKKYAQSVS